ncbi:MAG: hypothetical protein D6719_09330 [Candidatus Dadabacteria bacterium]|nr:MAG: hypothetical protein D6719_09330 [Candidatus Dadabacteria bacterium]
MSFSVNGKRIFHSAANKARGYFIYPVCFAGSLFVRVDNRMEAVKKDIIPPEKCCQIEERLSEPAWIYRYQHEKHGWVLCIATLAEPQSNKLSLGGFRIEPEERAALPGFSPEREAIDLAIGMQEKVSWTHVTRVGGPRALKELDRIVGGKCVLLPSAGSRVGEPQDIELLEFAAVCLNDVVESAGFVPVTGQDLGHGTLSDGKTSSLEFLHSNFSGAVLQDTSKPTAEGNFYLLRGVLRACGLELENARVGLIGCGNIGFRILERLREHNSTVYALEAREEKRAEIEALGISVWSQDYKEKFIEMDLDALVINANGGTLDPVTVEQIAANEAIKIVCGCENLVMPDPSGELVLRDAGKIFCPTELCGMMGYLTAVEEYLCRRAGEELDINTLFEAAKKLEEVGERAGRYALEAENQPLFEDAVRAVC